MKTGEFSFRWFAEQEFFRSVNAFLVDLAGLRPGQKVLELACGTGLVTRMLAEKLRGARDSLLIALDASASALREAMEGVGAVKDVALRFVLGRAERLSEVVSEVVDRVIFCNGIHLVPDKERLVVEVAQTLRPQGLFAFNTSFYQGSQPPETERFYRRWMVRALRLLKERYNLLPRPEKAEARRQLSPEQYRELLCRHGFTVLREEEKRVPVPLEGWVTISQYEEFIQGALPGVPLETGREVLQEGVRQTFQDLGLITVPRNWLLVIARKEG